MKTFACIALFVLAACGGKADPATEARAALERFQGLAKAGKTDDAMAMVAKAKREEMEKSGMKEMALAMFAGLDVKDLAAKVEGDTVTFSKEQKQGNMSMSVRVKMVREDGQWKLGD